MVNGVYPLACGIKVPHLNLISRHLQGTMRSQILRGDTVPTHIDRDQYALPSWGYPVLLGVRANVFLWVWVHHNHPRESSQCTVSHWRPIDVPIGCGRTQHLLLQCVQLTVIPTKTVDCDTHEDSWLWYPRWHTHSPPLDQWTMKPGTTVDCDIYDDTLILPPPSVSGRWSVILRRRAELTLMKCGPRSLHVLNTVVDGVLLSSASRSRR